MKILDQIYRQEGQNIMQVIHELCKDTSIDAITDVYCDASVYGKVIICDYIDIYNYTTND